MKHFILDESGSPSKSQISSNGQRGLTLLNVMSRLTVSAR